MYATIPKGNMGYDQYPVPDNRAVYTKENKPRLAESSICLLQKNLHGLFFIFLLKLENHCFFVHNGANVSICYHSEFFLGLILHHDICVVSAF